jgi:uncharacterized membrane protein HdeD (DUF308 family)
MERFVTLVVAGGLALVAGLWTLHLSARWTPAWLVGVSLVVAGVAGLAAGIWRELDVAR